MNTFFNNYIPISETVDIPDLNAKMCHCDLIDITDLYVSYQCDHILDIIESAEFMMQMIGINSTLFIKFDGEIIGLFHNDMFMNTTRRDDTMSEMIDSDLYRIINAGNSFICIRASIIKQSSLTKSAKIN